jgi:hypothetical protein
MVAHGDDLVVLEPDLIELDARLCVSDEHLSGEVRAPDGRWIAFDGWLGLIGAVETARTTGMSAPASERRSGQS